MFQCENCGKENNISKIHGRCGNCDNNNAENFVIINNNKMLSGMSLYGVRDVLISALNKEEILLIDPKSKLM
ncbi:hypothetical protein [Bacillus sp. JJ1127]|uniref:hypothetical protein n=1 Tax=Bacillus sp. JJ1127 TaxID=3122952 RepID=UPI002FFFBC07